MGNQDQAPAGREAEARAGIIIENPIEDKA